jgi:hypothetical protein
MDRRVLATKRIDQPIDLGVAKALTIVQVARTEAVLAANCYSLRLAKIGRQ